MECPRDGQALIPETVDQVVGYLCSGCGGAYVPPRYLDAVALVRRFDRLHFLHALQRATKGPASISCPHCHIAFHAADIEGVEVDWCRRCGSVWFDRGEVERAMRSYPMLHGNPAGEVAVGVVGEALFWLATILPG